MKRTIISLSLVLCLTGAMAGTTTASSFKDVAANAWYHSAVIAVADGDLMNGTSATTFSPTDPVTRGMAATVLWRLAGSPAPKDKAAFPDVEDFDFYADAAAWAAEAGVTSGYDNGRFGGGDAITREQLALFLYRYAQFSGAELASGVLDRFPDKDKIHGWALEGMAHAVGTGLITGRDKGTLDPLGTATRAQLAVILQRLMIPAVG